MARIHNIITLASSSRAVALNNGDQGYASTALATTASTDSRSCANKAVETIEREGTMVKRDFRVSDMDARKTLWALSQPKLEEGNEQICRIVSIGRDVGCTMLANEPTRSYIGPTRGRA